MKKNIVMVLVMTFMTLMAGWYCYADVTGVADTSKEGSLLVWPLIQTNGGNETYIVITNSNAGGNSSSEEEWDELVNLKCYWETREVDANGNAEGNVCYLDNAVFPLSINNPLIFRASDGLNLANDEDLGVPGIGPEKKGILKCWVVSNSVTNQISWNHLSGYAIIVHPEPGPKTSAFKYPAWRFAANVVRDNNGTEFADGFWVGKTLDGGDAFNWMKLWGGNSVVVQDASLAPPPTCPSGAMSSTCCRSGTVPIKLKQEKVGTTTYATYYCISKVNSTKCEPPFDAPTCDKPQAVYDACPQYLIFEFLAEPTPGAEPADGNAYNYLALAPCKEDLRTDGDASGEFDFYTRLNFSVWNANEVKYTGMYSCAHCSGPKGSTYDVYLKDVGNTKKGNYFMESYLHTDSGRFRVEGMAGGKCPGAQKTPLIGIMASQLIDPYGSTDMIATTGTGAGAAYNTINGNGKDTNPAWIKWDPAGEVWEKKHR